MPSVIRVTLIAKTTHAKYVVSVIAIPFARKEEKRPITTSVAKKPIKHLGERCRIFDFRYPTK